MIQTTRSLVSLGTEKMLVDFGKGSYLAKARSQPDKVKQVIQKVKTDGLWTTIDAVRAKLDTPIPLGYCNVGRVVEADVGSNFAIGDRVVSNGPHAEMVSVAKNLVAKIPHEVSDESASFTIVAAIGLQGIRLAQPTLGERFVVSGLGLIGLLTVQMLRAQGCEVMGIDFDPAKLELAKSFGATVVNLGHDEDPVRAAENWTNGVGVDGVIVTASTKSDELIHQCATMCRKRGRIVLVGVVGLNLRRADFYEKELSFQVSCSYGPGRYDEDYEQKGFDYPIGFVRWTEKRNFEAVLGLMRDGKLDTQPLISHRIGFDEALSGYEVIHDKDAMGIVLQYADSPVERVASRSIELGDGAGKPITGDPGVAFLGAGAFTTRMLLPLLPDHGIRRRWIISGKGVSAAHSGSKFGFEKCGTDRKLVFNDDSVDAVFITTPHQTHAGFVMEALRSGKHVFVEKPLAMNVDELDDIIRCIEECPEQRLMVGFNRRFSPHSVAAKEWLTGTPGPKAILITVNAGKIPVEHWTQDLDVGGGRIIGEACHFIDLARYFADGPIDKVQATAMRGGDGVLGDCASIQLSFADGSIASVHYLANGNKSFPKERVEIFAGGKVFVNNNFRRSYIVGDRQSVKSRSQDKGHAAEVKAFLATACKGGQWPIPVEQLIETSRATIEADQQIRSQIAERAS